MGTRPTCSSALICALALMLTSLIQPAQGFRRSSSLHNTSNYTSNYYHHQQRQQQMNRHRTRTNIVPDYSDVNKNHKHHKINRADSFEIMVPAFMMQGEANDTVDTLESTSAIEQSRYRSMDKLANNSLLDEQNRPTHQLHKTYSFSSPDDSKKELIIAIGHAIQNVSVTPDSASSLFSANNDSISLVGLRSRRFRSRLRRVSNHNAMSFTSIESNAIYADDDASSGNSSSDNGRYSDARERNNNNNNRHTSNNINNKLNNIIINATSSNSRHKGRKGHNARHYINNNKSMSNHKNVSTGSKSSAMRQAKSDQHNNHKDFKSSIHDHDNFMDKGSILLSPSLTLFNTSINNTNRNYTLTNVVLTGPTPLIFPLDDVTNTYAIDKGAGDGTGLTNATKERTGDPRRPYFPIKQEPTESTEREPVLSTKLAGHSRALRCYTCSATSSSDQACYDMPHGNTSLAADTSIPTLPCNDYQHFCIVSRVWFFFKNGSDRTEHQFSIQRGCEEKCDPYCIIMGDRTRIEINACRSCCSTPDCNTGNAAQAYLLQNSATQFQSVALLLAAVSVFIAS